MQFNQGDVFLRKNMIHSFEHVLLGACHFSRVPQIGLMSVARFSWVPNLYNIHFLVENHRPQPDPVNCHRVIELIKTQTLTFPMLHTSYLLPHWAAPHHLPNLHHTRAYIIIYIYIYI